VPLVTSENADEVAATARAAIGKRIFFMKITFGQRGPVQF